LIVTARTVRSHTSESVIERERFGVAGRFPEMNWRSLVGVLALAGVLAAACGDDDDGSANGAGSGDNGTAAGALAPYDDPDLARGQELFEANCAACHGVDLEGTDSGPPFLHEVYVPSHHGDIAFYQAAEQGVQPHHWDFGAMPPVPTVSREDIQLIVNYVRARQRDAGFTG
jgi:mono/diheme cytochrome c family protein